MPNQQRVDHVPLLVHIIGCDEMANAHDE
jgi:hypothetical protein